jgi:1-acyl-sn-glycerol-3-phosphate acyltransferase
LLKKNVFGQYIFLKKTIMRMAAPFTYMRFSVVNRNDIKGADRFNELQEQNVLFVSNHQTYFADVAYMVHAMGNAKTGKPNQITFWDFFLKPYTNFYYVAAAETMDSGIIPKLFKLTGSISIKRTWREAGENIKREVDKNDTESIERALKSGWVITFPQGTTKPFVEGRKGTAHIIKNYKPIVVPITVDGFRRAFDKKGLFIKKKGTTLKLTIKQPLVIDYDDTIENIMEQVMDAIEQSPKFNKVS